MNDRIDGLEAAMGVSTGWASPTPPPPIERTCVLCGETSPHVRHALIRWLSGAPFGSGPRCPDAGACWQRVMAQGDEWLLDDGRPARDGSGVEQPATLSDKATSGSRGLLPGKVRPEPAEEPAEELDFGEAPELVGKP